MITIKLIEEEGTLRPERQLTEEEQSTVIFTLMNGVDALYYQYGDELPVIDYGEDVE